MPESLIDRTQGPYVGLVQLCEQYGWPAVVNLRQAEWEEINSYVNPVRLLHDEKEGWYFLLKERTRCYPDPPLRLQDQVAPLRLDLRGSTIIEHPYP